MAISSLCPDSSDRDGATIGMTGRIPFGPRRRPIPRLLRMSRLTAIAVFILASAAGAGAFQGDADLISPKRWKQAEREIRRLAPQTFPVLPKSVMEYLAYHGYTIPQLYDCDEPHNVIRGYFNGDKSVDIAVLGSRRGYSEILVFWNSSTKRVAKLERRLDANFLQTVGDDKIGYSRGIEVVGREYILDHYRAYGGPQPPPIRHDAINDGFSGKASEVLYFDGKRWHTLQGAD